MGDTIVLSEAARKFAVEVYLPVRTELGIPAEELTEYTGEAFDVFVAEQGRAPRNADELDAWSNGTDEFAEYVKANPVESAAPAAPAIAPKMMERIRKAQLRANKAVGTHATMEQRVEKRTDRNDDAKAKARKQADETLRTALLDKLVAERKMALCDRSKAAANVAKLSAYVRQLTREGELKAGKDKAKADKKAAGPAVWGIRTPDGTVTPVRENDGTFGRLVGRAKKAAIGATTFWFILGDTCKGLVMDVENCKLVCNENVYAIDRSESGMVTVTKEAAAK